MEAERKTFGQRFFLEACYMTEGSARIPDRCVGWRVCVRLRVHVCVRFVRSAV